MEPVRVPLVLGLKVMLIVQEAAGFSVVPQVFAWLNGSDAAMLPMVRMPRPVFVRVTFWAGLVVRIVWSGKVKLVGENVTAGDTPVPVRDRA